MFYFIADARDGSAAVGCHTCCCEQMSMRPGETNMVEVNYANWAAPLRGQGLDRRAEISVSGCKNCSDKPNTGKAPAVDPTRINIDRRNYLLQFAIDVPIETEIGNIYTLTIKQTALDCDFQPFTHIMCIDLTVGKCG